MSDLIQNDPALDTEISRRDPLIEYFVSGCKPRERWRIGTEYEKVGVDRKTGRAAPYNGKRGIEELLRRMAERFEWSPRHEDGHIIALGGPRGANITLEPGAQLELSGEACDSIHCAHSELTEHVNQIVTIGDELGIAFLGLGIQPVSAVEEIEWVPKERYRIMAPYMRTVGSLGHRMMKQTATVQTNIDFSDERDAMEKMRVAMGLAPILTAMFANSSISDGRLNGYMSFRQHIWTDTDRDRSGLLPFVFSRDAGFEDYVDWALGVPMYFIRREGRLVDLTGLPFREFLRRGAAGHHAKLADWQLHLTTLFPEVRLKTYIELRSVDSQPPERMLALPALSKGVLYDDDCLLGAWDLVKAWSWNERVDAYLDSHKEALQARVRGVRLLELARELCAIARVGLKKQNVRNGHGEDETIYLAGLERQLELGRSPARVIAERWEREWDEKIEKLIDFASYRIS
jgi:glutamate--cysteine ligase